MTSLAKSHYFGAGAALRRPQKPSGHLHSNGNIIVGGVCDTEHHARATRERGAIWLFNRGLELGCLIADGKKVTIKSIPDCAGPEFEKSACEFKIGAYRAQYYLGERRGETLTVKHVKAILIGNTANSSQINGKPHQGGLYRKRKREGQFKGVGLTG